MASFYAELHLSGGTYRVVHCHFACYQDTDTRGRVRAKVRYAPLKLVVDVPTDSVLLDWAAAPHKPLAGSVVFYDTAQQVAHETIVFSEGHCVHYGERFASGATGDGAYVCQLTITASSFELRAGGPAAVMAIVEAERIIEDEKVETLHAGEHIQEDPTGNRSNKFTLIARNEGLPQLHPNLASMIGTTFMVAFSGGPRGPENFTNLVLSDLQAIHNTPTGQKLLESLHASGKKIYIRYPDSNKDGNELNSIEFNKALFLHMFYAPDGTTPGAGLAVPINYNPNLVTTGLLPWNTRPPAIGLAHELIHAEQAAYGRMRRGDANNPGGRDIHNPEKYLVVPQFELDNIGIHPEYNYEFTENKIRAEWNPPQPTRNYY